MREIRVLNETHIDAYTDIAYHAYPSFKDFTEEAMAAYKKTVAHMMDHDPAVTFYGMFEGDKMIGVMRLFQFQMNYFGKMISVSGLGFLGIHLMHKKEKVAKAMVEFYENHFREKGLPIGLLLPFRPDFYKRMGYGMGTKMNQYRLPPSRIPAYSGKSDLRYITRDNLQELFECHGRIAARTHGMMLKFGDEIRNLTTDPFNQIVGYYSPEGQLIGYLVFKFQNGKAGNYTINHLYVKELVYENIDAFRGLLDFLKKQEDQVSLVIFNTEDEHFHYLFDNPLNDSLNYIPYGYIESNTQAVGVMYKLFDIRGAFQQCSYRNYNNANLRVRFLITDELRGIEETLTINFQNGAAQLDAEDFDITMKTSIAHFSSLFMGSTSVNGLYHLGLLAVDNINLLDDLDRAFYCPQKPVCYTDF